MRAEIARADRRRAVRSAARAWRDTGTIDDAAYRAIEADYPDDRVRLGPALRLLAGLVAGIGGLALVALLVELFDPEPGAILFLVIAVLLAAATELQTGRLRRAQAGAEYATALLAVGASGIAWSQMLKPMSTGAICAFFAATLALAAWRWGYASFAALAGMLVLAASSQHEHARIVWLVLGLVALPSVVMVAEGSRCPPSHRSGLEAAGLVFVAAAYVAINVYSLDQCWIENLLRAGVVTRAPWVRYASIAGTALAPPFVAVVGLRYRHRTLLAVGALFAAASLITLRRYHPIGPPWLALVAAGSACLALALAARRWLDAGPDRERSGFTAEPLFDKRRMPQAVQAAATIVAMSPGPRTAGDPPFAGGGGRSGGGGATGGA